MAAVVRMMKYITKFEKNIRVINVRPRAAQFLVGGALAFRHGVPAHRALLLDLFRGLPEEEVRRDA